MYYLLIIYSILCHFTNTIVFIVLHVNIFFYFPPTKQSPAVKTKIFTRICVHPTPLPGHKSDNPRPLTFSSPLPFFLCRNSTSLISHHLRGLCIRGLEVTFPHTNMRILPTFSSHRIKTLSLRLL